MLWTEFGKAFSHACFLSSVLEWHSKTGLQIVLFAAKIRPPAAKSNKRCPNAIAAHTERLRYRKYTHCFGVS